MVKKIRQYNAEYGKRVVAGSDDTFGMVADDLSNALPTDETPIGLDDQAGIESAHPGSANPTLFHKPTCPPPPPPRRKRIKRDRAQKADVHRLFIAPAGIFTDDFDLPNPSVGITANSLITRDLRASHDQCWFWLDPDDGSVFFISQPENLGASVLFGTMASQAEIDTFAPSEVSQSFNNPEIIPKYAWGMQGSKIVYVFIPQKYYGNGAPLGNNPQQTNSAGVAQSYVGGGIVVGGPGPGTKLECYSLFNEIIPITYSSTAGVAFTSNTDDQTFSDGSTYDNENLQRVDGQSTSASGSVSGVGIFAFCNPTNAFSTSGSYSYNGDFTFSFEFNEVGTTQGYVLNIDEDDNYSRVDITGNYNNNRTRTDLQIFRHSGTFSSFQTFGTGFPSCPPTVVIGADITSAGQVTTVSNTLTDANTYTHQPIEFDLFINPAGDTEKYSVTLPSTGHTLEHQYNFSASNPSPNNKGGAGVCQFRTVGDFPGGDDWADLNDPTYDRSPSDSSTQVNGTYPPYSVSQSYPFVIVVVDDKPIWVEHQQDWSTSSTFNETTGPIWDIVLRGDIASGAISGPLFKPLTQRFNFITTAQTGAANPWEQSSGWQLAESFKIGISQLGAGYTRGFNIITSGPPDRDGEFATATVSATQIADEMKVLKYGDQVIDHLDSFFLGRMNSFGITTNVTASQITISRAAIATSNASLSLFSTIGLEAYANNPSVLNSVFSTAPNIQGGSSTLTSSIDNLTAVVNKLQAQDWWICIRDEGVNFPETLTYTLYDCTLSSYTVTDVSTSGFAGSSQVYLGWDTNQRWRGIQFDTMTFTINSERTVEHFPIIDRVEAVSELIADWIPTAAVGGDYNIAVTTKNMLAMVLQLRDYLTINSGSWYVTNRQADNQLSEFIMPNPENRDMFGSKLSFDRSTAELTYDSSFCYTVPVIYTNEDDNIKLLSKKVKLDGFLP